MNPLTMEDPSVNLEIRRIMNSDTLPEPPFPQPPDLSASNLSVRERLRLIQKYISSLEYNYTGNSFFVKRKDRGFRHVTSTAKLIVREALPIQCVEAVFLGAYLTTDMKEVVRFPVCFKSMVDGQVFRHIILAVRSGNKWGALGISRRETLMYKDLRHTSFSGLLEDFRLSYARNWHKLEHVCVGFPFPHDVSSNLPIKWKVMLAHVGEDQDWATAAANLDSYVACAPALLEKFTWSGCIPDHPLLLQNHKENDCASRHVTPQESNGEKRTTSPPQNLDRQRKGWMVHHHRGMTSGCRIGAGVHVRTDGSAGVITSGDGIRHPATRQGSGIYRKRAKSANQAVTGEVILGTMGSRRRETLDCQSRRRFIVSKREEG